MSVDGLEVQRHSQSSLTTHVLTCNLWFVSSAGKHIKRLHIIITSIRGF